ncbi:glycine cleavage system aminomethyltransferase GcvT [Thermanaeromonas sp. C210]|uniref:glycine cleavage system aminomethyltransferase GcvT n=1 Tax=Thermanaeromonas sp. C210 TaxID=2731925 RepID=UPI00155D4A85|nr:glycine cleavage system aminomethyltransferase GcvT [Thermanaeromonas sp. C210]GFN23404.1 hypothetical protein TAMC210_17210 [Thermanaeromonas sp. C210]
MKHTPLYERHMQMASKVINLKGFARPVEYFGHIQEHHAVRERVSICDVSHMGEFEIKGKDALALVQKLITNDASKLSINQALYAVMCNENGGIIDDLICYRLGEDHFLWVVNVTKTEEDYQWVLKQSQGMNVTVKNLSCEIALIALQGPNSREVLQRVTKADLSELKYYWLANTVISTESMEVPCIISRTGYTGELGYEIFVSRELAPLVWDELLLVGRPLGIIPHGVAARESLRIEAGYLLNGNDMDEETNPFEVGLEWVVKFSKEFIGKQALLKILENGISRKLVGFEVLERYTVRYGYPIYKNGKQIGHVTSGPLSPSLINRSAGLGFVPVEYSDVGTEIEIGIREKKCKARIVPVPFCKRRVKDEPVMKTHSPYNLRFSTFHVWVHQETDNVFTLGITDFIQRDLGDILFIELPKVGDKIVKDSILGWVDAYRKVWDIKSPLSGEVIEINTSLLENPEQINKYPYTNSGLVRIKVNALDDYKTLLRYEEYMEVIRQLRRYDNWSKEKRIT